MLAKGRLWTILSLLVVMAMVLPSCAAPTPAPPPEATPTPPPPEATPTPPPPPEKRVLRATFAWPTYIDPAVGSDFSSTSSLVNLYDTLVFPNTEGGVDPDLAESWETSEDGLTWTFHLKKGIKFHNGSELTASDVAFSMNRMLEITIAHLVEAI